MIETTGGSDGARTRDLRRDSPTLLEICKYAQARMTLRLCLNGHKACESVTVGDHCFLARWGGQAEALGWTAKDLFGLQTPPDPSYSRLSRYDETGLIWLLYGREVVALTEATVAIQNPTGAITIYRRHNKPALGPVGDSLDDLEPPLGAA
jgi:hypothetical protein